MPDTIPAGNSDVTNTDAPKLRKKANRTPAHHYDRPMSHADRFRWREIVRDDPDFTSTEKLALYELALTFLDSETGQCNPRDEAVALAIGLKDGRHTVMDARDKARSKGLMAWIPDYRIGGGVTSNRYRLLLPEGMSPRSRSEIVKLANERAERNKVRARSRVSVRTHRGSASMSGSSTTAVEVATATMSGQSTTAMSDQSATAMSGQPTTQNTGRGRKEEEHWKVEPAASPDGEAASGLRPDFKVQSLPGRQDQEQRPGREAPTVVPLPFTPPVDETTLTAAGMSMPTQSVANDIDPDLMAEIDRLSNPVDPKKAAETDRLEFDLTLMTYVSDDERRLLNINDPAFKECVSVFKRMPPEYRHEFEQNVRARYQKILPEQQLTPHLIIALDLIDRKRRKSAQAAA